MTNNPSAKHFTGAYFSFSALPVFFQLHWAKHAFDHSDILLRVGLSVLLTAPLFYLLLICVHGLRSLVGKKNFPGALRLLFPCSLLHLEWMVYASQSLDRVGSAIVICVASVVLLAVLLRDILAGKTATDTVSTPGALGAVNAFFFDGFRGWARGIRIALGGSVRVAGLDFFPVTWVVLSMHIVLFVNYASFSFPIPWLFPFAVAGTVLMPVLLFQTIQCSAARIPFAPAILSGGVAILYFLLSLYYLTEGTPFDFSILRLNADLLSHGQSYDLLIERMKPESFIFIGVYTAAAATLPLFRNPRHAGTVSKRRCGIGAAAYFALLVLPLQNMDQIRSCCHSVLGYLQQGAALRKASATISEHYPYYKNAITSAPPAGPLPNIIIICLESCNGMFVEERIEDGREITPFFNRLIPRGVYPEHFYGNSVQTARGFFSLLTGVPAGFRGKETTDAAGLSIRGLPAILRDAGYSTFFMKAFHDLSFDNTGEFMAKAGYSFVRSMTENMLTEEEKGKRWGWGLQDDYFYRKYFRIIDEEYGVLPDSVKRAHPALLTIFNVSNHQMFQQLPADCKRLYPDAKPAEFRKNFRNSMFFADSCLREVFAQIKARPWLDNSIIVIVGDHGFPGGDHSMKNECGAWEENFRTPFLLLWEGRVSPRRLSEHAYSQVDLLPTILDLIDISPAHHATGTSILNPERTPVLLTQPYDGVSLVCIDYPYKLVENFSTKRRALFNVDEDPMERINCISRTDVKSITERLQGGITALKINQMLIENNRLWPTSAGDY